MLELSYAQDPSVGDIIKVPSHSADIGNSVQIDAHLENGATCPIGTGSLADAGGSLLVIGTGPGYVVHAMWGGTGRSARSGDCGNGSRIRMGKFDVLTLQAAVAGLGPTP